MTETKSMEISDVLSGAYATLSEIEETLTFVNPILAEAIRRGKEDQGIQDTNCLMLGIEGYDKSATEGKVYDSGSRLIHCVLLHGREALYCYRKGVETLLNVWDNHRGLMRHVLPLVERISPHEQEYLESAMQLLGSKRVQVTQPSHLSVSDRKFHVPYTIVGAKILEKV